MDSYRLFRAGALSGAATLVAAFVLMNGNDEIVPVAVVAVAPEATPEVPDASELTAQLAVLLETLPAPKPQTPALPVTEVRRIVAEMPAELLQAAPPEPVEAIAAAAMEALAETGGQPEIEVSASRLAEAEEMLPVWTPAAGALPDAAPADLAEGWLAAAGINDGAWEIRPLPRRN